MSNLIGSGALAFDKVLYDFAKRDKPSNKEPTFQEIGNLKVDFFNGCTVGLISSVAFSILGVIPVSSMVALGVLFLIGRLVADASLS